jgi:predicted transcriptional regulator
MTYEERSTKIMMEKPITELSKLIGAKWFLTLEQLAEKSGVPLLTLRKAIRGMEISSCYEKKLREFLSKL